MCLVSPKRFSVISHFSCVWLFVPLWTVAHQAPLSMGFSRQEYWSGLPCPPPGDLPHPGIEPMSLMSPALIDGFFTTIAPWEAQVWAMLRYSCHDCSQFLNACTPFSWTVLLFCFCCNKSPKQRLIILQFLSSETLKSNCT